MKLSIRYFSFFAIFCFLLSCLNQELRSRSAKKDILYSVSTKRSQPDTIGNLEYFSSFPNHFGLAGDYYTFDTSKLSGNKYIFLCDLTDTAAIKINGEIVYLYIDTLNSKKLSDDVVQDVWKGNGYNVILILKVIKEDDEEVYCVGTLEIIKGSKKKKFKIHGVSIA